MRKLLLFLLFTCFLNSSYAVTSESKRREYALKFHEAFVLQSIGLSTQAFNRFLDAFNLGMKEGESSRKLQVIADLFYWYRQHGACMKLFGRQPYSREKILGEYCNCGESHDSNTSAFRTNRRVSVLAASHHGMVLAEIPDYRSEYGTTPEQAALVRDFIFGAGEIIAGVLAISIGRSAAAVVLGAPMIYSGVKTMWSSGNMLWAKHESALLELKQVTDRAEKEGQ